MNYLESQRENKHFGNVTRGIMVSKKAGEKKEPENVWPKTIGEEPGEGSIPGAKGGKKRGAKTI